MRIVKNKFLKKTDRLIDDQWETFANAINQGLRVLVRIKGPERTEDFSMMKNSNLKVTAETIREDLESGRSHTLTDYPVFAGKPDDFFDIVIHL